MLSFKQFLVEMEILNKEKMLVHQPSLNKISRMIDSSPDKEVRAVHHADHGLFVGDANNYTHMDISTESRKKHGFEMENPWKKTNHFMIGKDKKTGALVANHCWGQSEVDHPVLNKIEKHSDQDYNSKRIKYGD